jgi:hypothetical protein
VVAIHVIDDVSVSPVCKAHLMLMSAPHIMSGNKKVGREKNPKMKKKQKVKFWRNSAFLLLSFTIFRPENGRAIREARGEEIAVGSRKVIS